MSRLDLVIFGATGFTGKHTVKHMVEFAKKYEINSWGVAARSEKKLHEVMNEIAQQTGKYVQFILSSHICYFVLLLYARTSKLLIKIYDGMTLFRRTVI